jgi:apolipoprotein D and lipocalin family protein
MTHRMSLFLGLSAFLLVSSAMRASAAKPPGTAEHVDLQRYLGRWYEIAKIPNRFQSQCTEGTTAEYTLRDDGRIDVINRCRTEDGSIDEARGIAKIEDRVSNARLKVSFVRLLGISLFWGDYWILDVGEDYEYAVIGSPTRKYGWVLSRTPSLDSAKLAYIFKTLRQQGYDPDEFEMTRQ